MTQSPPREVDILIVGGGIAGAGAAYELSASSSVVVLERESQCGYHSTGRSAASFTENYGNSVIRRLAIASRSFLEAPPDGFCDHALMTPRGMLTIARADQLGLLSDELEHARALVPSIHEITPAAAIELVPVLRRDYVAGAIVEPDSRELDVDGLHRGFLRAARKRGAEILTNAGVEAIGRRDGRWIVETAHGRFAAAVIVNAAGAWADRLAAMAGVDPVGLMPKRRTAFQIAAPDAVPIAAWPLVNDVGEEFYFKPDAGRIFVSPSDATPSEPMDAYAGRSRCRDRRRSPAAGHDDRGSQRPPQLGGSQDLCRGRLAGGRPRRRCRRILLAGRPGRLRHQDIAGAVARLRQPDPPGPTARRHQAPGHRGNRSGARPVRTRC